MKKAYRYLIGFIVLCLCFFGIYYISYQAALNSFGLKESKRNAELLQELESLKKQIEESSLQEKEELKSKETITMDLSSTSNKEELTEVDRAAFVSAHQADIISSDTTFILETYYLKEDIWKKNKYAVPSYLMNRNRNEVIQYVSNYMLNIPLDDFEQGLISYEVISFSANKVVLRKIYDTDLIDYKYVIGKQKGKIVVYYSDRKTVYEHTNIDSSHLTKEEQDALNEGIEVKDQEKLYSILQGYTS